MVNADIIYACPLRSDIYIYFTSIRLKGKLSIFTCSKITYKTVIPYDRYNIYNTTPLDKLMSRFQNQLFYNKVLNI